MGIFPWHLLTVLVYTPPNAAKMGFHVYEELTGEANHVYQCQFYSEQGRKNVQ